MAILRGDIVCILILLFLLSSSSMGTEENRGDFYSGQFQILVPNGSTQADEKEPRKGRISISRISEKIQTLTMELNGFVYRTSAEDSEDPNKQLQFPMMKLRKPGLGHCVLDKLTVQFTKKDGEKKKLHIQESGNFKEYLKVDDFSNPFQTTSSESSEEVKESDSKIPCEFKMDASLVPVAEISSNVRLFAFVSIVLTIFQFRSTVNWIESNEESGRAAKISILLLFALQTHSIIEAVTSLFLGLIGQFMFSTFGMIAFLKFMLFSVLESRIMIQIARSVNPQSEWEEFRNEVRKVYAQFHVVLLTAIIMCLLFIEQNSWCILIGQFYWMPQIIMDAVKGTKNSIPMRYVIFSSLARLWLPLFMVNASWLSPVNFFDGELYPAAGPASSLGSWIIFIQGIQVVTILLQRKLGPRFFVPYVFLPGVYNYYRPVTSAKYGLGDVEMGEMGQHECVICMGSIEEGKLPAVTPCGHSFHGNCLAEWIDIKMECPTCRHPLPPM
jgi:transmembrane E3 ubiquitin-protein ligase